MFPLLFQPFWFTLPPPLFDWFPLALFPLCPPFCLPLECLLLCEPLTPALLLLLLLLPLLLLYSLFPPFPLLLW